MTMKTTSDKMTTINITNNVISLSQYSVPKRVGKVAATVGGSPEEPDFGGDMGGFDPAFFEALGGATFDFGGRSTNTPVFINGENVDLRMEEYMDEIVPEISEAMAGEPNVIHMVSEMNAGLKAHFAFSPNKVAYAVGSFSDKFYSVNVLHEGSYSVHITDRIDGKKCNKAFFAAGINTIGFVPPVE